MHLWHHDYDGDAQTTVNFGIIFSCWDWLFGTAKLPAHPPARIGFDGVESYPKNFFAAEAWFVPGWFNARLSRAVAAAGGAVLIVTGLWAVGWSPFG
jgi:sterol desaturase/sphingolipid hydroxylase (fatty acid hydroxylase superfamily)